MDTIAQHQQTGDREDAGPKRAEEDKKREREGEEELKERAKATRKRTREFAVAFRCNLNPLQVTLSLADLSR